MHFITATRLQTTKSNLTTELWSGSTLQPYLPHLLSFLIGLVQLDGWMNCPESNHYHVCFQKSHHHFLRSKDNCLTWVGWLTH